MELVNYKLSEKVLNTVSHAIFAVIYLVFMILFLKSNSSAHDKVAFSIYTISMFIMFFNSSLYHGVPKSKFQYIMRAIDHSSVFIAIAGTYTPLLLIGIGGAKGLIATVLIWISALTGIILKIITFTRGKVGKTENISLFLYLLLGWISVFFIPALYRTYGMTLILWIILGGVFYSVGVYFYKNKKIKFNHFIWHLFIIFGSMSHYMAIRIIIKNII